MVRTLISCINNGNSTFSSGSRQKQFKNTLKILHLKSSIITQTRFKVSFLNDSSSSLIVYEYY
jgi:hypothetical protein